MSGSHRSIALQLLPATDAALHVDSQTRKLSANRWSQAADKTAQHRNAVELIADQVERT